MVNSSISILMVRGKTLRDVCRVSMTLLKRKGSD